MRRTKSTWVIGVTVFLALILLESTLSAAEKTLGNQKERLEWFRDLGFGLFIHWSLDSQLGAVISHSLVGASDDYINRYFELLPRTFDPEKFNPDDWAVLAKFAGFKYVVFTAKHHSGFCMFNTATTRFSIMNTPFRKDVTAEIVRAFRGQGFAIGLYFSPDDFHFLHSQGKVIARAPHRGVTPQEDPPLLEYDRAQIRELLTRYGNIDIVFLDGPAEGLRELCWELRPNVVVTRGAMETPEQYVPGVPLEGAWESNLTMGTAWQYKPTNESYKSGTELINTLIETRAKGGNLLLNVGPKPNGELPIEQEERLRELALWNFVNGEAIVGVRPWVVTNEGNIWFTKKKDEDTVYAFVTRTLWKYGEPMTFTLRSVKATNRTTVELLGQSGEVLEYRPDVIPRAKWHTDQEGLHITATRAQRLYNNKRWPNPPVLKLTHAQVGMFPPKIRATGAEWDLASGTATLHGVLENLGDAESVEVAFEYRHQRGEFELYEPEEAWTATTFQKLTSPGPFAAKVTGLKRGLTYEFRTVAKHPMITIRSQEKNFTAND